MTTECQCNYGSLKITQEDFQQMGIEFTQNAVELFLRQTKGFIQHEDTSPVIRCIAEDYKELLAKPMDDVDAEEARKAVVNALSDFYPEPAYFRDAIRELEYFVNGMEQAIESDTKIASTPIPTKIVTPQVFLYYFQSQ